MASYENTAGGLTYELNIASPRIPTGLDTKYLTYDSALERSPHLLPLDIGPDFIIRRTENFLVVTGRKHYRQEMTPGEDQNNSGFLRFYIIPVAYDNKENQERAEAILERAAQQHQIPTEFRLVLDAFGDTKMCLCVRFDFSEKNWQDYIKADLSLPPEVVKPDTLPPIGYMQLLYDTGLTTYQLP